MEGGSLQEEQKRELRGTQREQTGVEGESEGESEGFGGARGSSTGAKREQEGVGKGG